MSQITRVPRGLQKYLGTQNQGQNPVELGQVVTPIVAMDQFYSIRNDRWQATAFSPTAIDTTFIVATVPDGEIWNLKRVSWTLAFAGATTGDSCRPGLTIQQSPNVSLSGQTIPLNSFGTVVFNAGSVRIAQEADTLVQGGSILLAVVTDVLLTAGAINGAIYVNYDRISY